MTDQAVLFGAGIERLAVSLDKPSDLLDGTPYEQTTGIDASSGPVTLLSLTGGTWRVSMLVLEGLTSTEEITVTLTVDGTIIWNDTYSPIQTTQNLLGRIAEAGCFGANGCNSTYLLELTTAVDTDVDFSWVAEALL